MRQIGHEFRAQRLLHALDDFLLDSFHLQHAIDAVERKVFRKNREHARGVFGAQFRENDRDCLRVFVLEIVRQHLFLDVRELLPHVAACGTADLVHDAADALGGEVLLEQPFGSVVVAEQCTGGRHAADEFEQELLDGISFDRAERRHHDGDFSQFVVV